MNRFDAVTIANLVRSWVYDLEMEIARLDKELPLERRMEVSHRFAGAPLQIFGGGAGSLFKTPTTDPEMFEQVETSLPHVELDGLRELVDRLSAYAEALADEVKGLEDGAEAVAQDGTTYHFRRHPSEAGTHAHARA